MDNINEIIKKLKKLGFRTKQGSGSRLKLYPPNPQFPFYALHVGEQAIHPLKRYSLKNWNIDLTKL